MKKILVCFLIICYQGFSQPPNISYVSPNVFNVGETISDLIPTNTGGIIIAQRVVSTFAGSGNVGDLDGNGTAASFNLPTVVTLDSHQNVFVVDRINNKIRKITPAGDVTTYAGSGGFGSDDGPALLATFTYPDGAVFDSQDNLYVSDQSIHKIRKITPDGTVSTLSGTGVFGDVDGPGNIAQFYYPAGMAVDANDNLYVADYGNNKIRKITADGTVSTFAGTGAVGSADGTVTTAEFNGCTGVCVDVSQNVYVADYYNNKIRKIDTLGNVTTIAGTGAIGFDDGIGTSASFHYPAIVAIGTNNTLLITDEENNKIRKIDANGIVSTYAGTGTIGATDGLSSLAEFYNATGVTMDNSNNVYVCDYGNNKIRKINEYGYSISPSLPLGLLFDTSTGIISGTPTATLASTDFTITARNQDGFSNFVVNITIGQLGLSNFNTKDIQVYPNPAKEILNIKSTTNITEIKIINLLGQEVLTKNNLSSDGKVDISSLTKGWYFVKVALDNSLIFFKILKQ